MSLELAGRSVSRWARIGGRIPRISYQGWLEDRHDGAQSGDNLRIFKTVFGENIAVLVSKDSVPRAGAELSSVRHAHA